MSDKEFWARKRGSLWLIRCKQGETDFYAQTNMDKLHDPAFKHADHDLSIASREREASIAATTCWLAPFLTLSKQQDHAPTESPPVTHPEISSATPLRL